MRLGQSASVLPVSPTQIPAMMAAKISLACRQFSCQRGGHLSTLSILQGIVRRCMDVCPGRPVNVLHQMLEVKGEWPLRSQNWLKCGGPSSEAWGVQPLQHRRHMHTASPQVAIIF